MSGKVIRISEDTARALDRIKQDEGARSHNEAIHTLLHNEHIEKLKAEIEMLWKRLEFVTTPEDDDTFTIEEIRDLARLIDECEKEGIRFPDDMAVRPGTTIETIRAEAMKKAKRGVPCSVPISLKMRRGVDQIKDINKDTEYRSNLSEYYRVAIDTYMFNAEHAPIGSDIVTRDPGPYPKNISVLLPKAVCDNIDRLIRKHKGRGWWKTRAEFIRTALENDLRDRLGEFYR